LIHIFRRRVAIPTQQMGHRAIREQGGVDLCRIDSLSQLREGHG
jgi:hypothetical protein